MTTSQQAKQLNIYKEPQALVFTSFLVATFLVLFFCIHESYLYSHIFIYDSAWYFICGKAWVEGLKPYIDFADSKGPLLWSIYALAYKLHSYSLVGVLWLASGFYTVTLWFIYKSFKLMGLSLQWAFIGSLCWLALVFIFPLSHPLLHTEDFSLSFISIVFYLTFRLFFQSSSRLHLLSFLTGCCFGAILMIKFFTASLLVGFILAQGFYVYKQRLSLLTYLFYLAMGTCLVCLPFVLYFLYTNSLYQFVNEYVVKTILSYCTHRNMSNPPTLYYVYMHTQSVAMGLASVLLFMAKSKRYAYLPLLLFIPFALSELVTPFPQYGLPTNIFVFFSLLFILHKAQKHVFSLAWAKAFTFILLGFSIAFQLYRNVIKNATISDFCFVKNQTNTAFAKYSYLVAQIPHAGVLYKKGVLTDIGYTSGALPACKYFAEQYGATPKMKASEQEAIIKRKADFIASEHNDTSLNAFLTKHGYIEYYYENPNGYTLFSKYKLKEPAKDYCLSPTDVLLKRRPWLNEKK